MLAEATVRLHEDLVRREDFTTLTKTVERLAERTDRIAVAQEQTAQELRELAIVQKETGRELKALAVVQKNLAESQAAMQESTKAMQSQIGELTSTTKAVQSQIGELSSTTKVMQGQIGELTSATKAMQSQIGELTSTSKVMQSQIGELTATSKAIQSQIGELTSTSKATQEQIATLAWAMKDTQKQLGGLAQSVGYGLEAYAMDRIPRILTKQLGFLEESSGPEQFIAVSGSQDDIDVVVRGTLDGRPIVFLCEAKTKISPQEVHDFLATADRVRPKIGCDDVRIFYFAYRASPEARAAVRDIGGYLAFPHTILVEPLD
jgi:septal ring factor EnvC (AmiA/AmiB activator)